jgi:hypothetical protein
LASSFANVGAVEDHLAAAHQALQRKNETLAQLQVRYRGILYAAAIEAARRIQ